MKTFEEVKKHVCNNGYNSLAISKIEGFLIGIGILKGEYEIDYLIGELGFEEFMNWFNNEHQEQDKTTKQEPQHDVDCTPKNIDEAFEELRKAVNHMYDDLHKRYIDELYKLEIKCVESVENIMATIYAGTLDEDEEAALIRSLQAFVELGKMYE